MSTDDPFSLPDSDRTMMAPPGRGAAPQAPQGPAAVPDAGDVDAPAAAGLNPLVAAANPLLDVVPQLRATLRHPDPAALRDELARAIRRFEQAAQAAGVAGPHVVAARYALCTVLDEAAASSPWGGSGVWARHSLLVMFHNEAWGGEKFFQLLGKLAETPAATRDLLQLMYICLALGFKGRYQVESGGMAALDSLRARLAALLRKDQGEPERDLSPHWRGASAPRTALLGALPLWSALAALGLVALAAYWAFAYALNEASDPVYAQVAALGAAGAAPAPPPPAPAAAPRLAALLAPDLAARMIDVRDEAGRSIVTLRGDGLFAPGSAEVAPAYLPTLERVARALDTQPGPVRVVGHTDDQPIRSARFPSNWHLSQARAQAVAQLLQAHARDPARYRVEGRADAEPLEPNASAAQRARNRRVEIVLAVQAPGAQ